jgi:hypothetical protein
MRPILLPAFLAAALAAAASPAGAADWSAVASALGKSGTEGAGGVYRVGLPRTDLTVTLDGITLKPTFALGSWVAFLPMGDKVMAMGDLVLTEDEVGPVMKKLGESGIQISALHNHLFHASPVTLYMHIYGEGDGVKLATAIHEGLALSKTPFPAPQAALAAPPPAIDLDTAAIDAALGAKGSNSAGVYQVAIARSAPVKEGGMALPVPMGASEAINFQPLGGGKAAITGDFMLTAAEVNPVLRALRANGIEVTALHNHMLTDEPRLFFMHFWAHDDLPKLLGGLKAALGHVAVKRS